MHKAFLSLYALIVTSVILVGLGFDALIGLYEPDEAVTASDYDLMQLLEARCEGAVTDCVPESFADRLSVYLVNDFASTQMAQRLMDGQPVAVHAERDWRQLYWLTQDEQKVLMLRQSVVKDSNAAVYNALLVVFYLLIALVVFVWVRPLSRDLRKLERQTRLIGQAHLASPLTLGQASPVFDLANSFNRMSQRVKSLLASHKEMTYAVSHELRTPLARMKFALAMAQNRPEPDKLQQQLAGLQEDVAEMDALVNQLLTYAGFEHSSMTLQQQSGDLGYMAAQVIARLEAAAPDKHKRVELLDRLAGQPVTCEWQLLERALHNLVQNALRFAQTKVRVTLARKNGAFQVLVEDDGPGIAPEDRDRVFESFVRLTTGAGNKVGGFGLGLAIVRRVALWHNGGVTLDASALGGARFCLYWP